MSWRLNDQEFKSVMSLTATRRYDYLIKKIVDSQVLWSLSSDDGWVLMGKDDGQELIPVWPHEKFAAACISEDWKGSKPQAISLDEWMEHWIPGILQDRRLIAAFPNPAHDALIVPPDGMLADLKEELLQYE